MFVVIWLLVGVSFVGVFGLGHGGYFVVMVFDAIVWWACCFAYPCGYWCFEGLLCDVS